MSEAKAAIAKAAAALRLPAFSRYEEYINKAKPFEDNLLSILGEQLSITNKERIKRKIRHAGFPYIKNFDNFETSAERYPYLNSNELREMASCRFIEEKADVIAVGPSGHGKTHAALAIGYEAVKRGFNVRFKRASDLVNEMAESKTEKHLANYIKVLNRCDLLIIDELGYLNYDLDSSSLLFQIVGARYETGSTFYTSNLEFSKWVQFLGNKDLASAIVSRIAHQAIVLNMNGPKGWRLEHARSLQKTPDSQSLAEALACDNT
jgi:DNA replication protein DnaC